MSASRKVAYNTALQVAGRIIGLLITYFTINYVANHLAADGSLVKGFGQYSIVLAYISVIGSVADLGLYTLLVRELAIRPKAEQGKIIGNALLFRLLLFGLSLALVSILTPFLPYDALVKQAIVVGVIVAFAMLFSQVIAAIFQAEQRVDRIIIAETLGKIVLVILTIVAIRAGTGLLGVVGASLIGNLVIFMVSYALAGHIPIRLQLDFGLWRSRLTDFWPIALVSILGLIHFRIDSLILSFYRSAEAVGIYAAAYKFFDVALIVPAVFTTNLLPVLTNLASQDQKDRFRFVTERSLLLVLTGGAMVALIGFQLAGQLVVFLTSTAFSDAAAALRILILAFTPAFMTYLFAQAVIAKNQQRSLVVGYTVAVIVNILANLYFIPRYGYLAAAWVTVGTELILMAFTGMALYRHTRVVPSPVRALPIAISALVSALVLSELTFWRYPLELFGQLGKLSQVGWLVSETIVIALTFLVLLWICLGFSWTRLKTVTGLVSQPT